jgi:opacity protein-like surface antigen
MKKVASIVCALLVLLVFSSSVMAEDTKGIYVGLVGGYVIPTGISGIIQPNDGRARNEYDPSLKNGYLYGAKAGWLTPFTNRILALELEYNHITNDFDKAKRFISPEMPDADLDLNSKINIDLIMFNMIARYPNGRFHPYVGAGAGYAYAKINDTVVSLEGEQMWTYNGGSKGVFAYQGIAGIDFDITKNIIVGLAYKYIGLQKITYDTIVLDGPEPSVAELNYRSHNITLSLSYMF